MTQDKRLEAYQAMLDYVGADCEQCGLPLQIIPIQEDVYRCDCGQTYLFDQQAYNELADRLKGTVDFPRL